MRTFKDLLIELGACEEAREWAGDMTIEEVVEKCHRGDWLLWLAQKIKIDEKLRYLTSGHCANTVRHLMDDERSTAAVDAAIAYGEGKINKEELRLKKVCFHVILSKTGSSFYAANAAIRAICASYETAATAVAAAAATGKDNQLETANICRKYLGEEIINKVNQML